MNVPHLLSISDLLQDPAKVAEVPAEQIPTLLGDLERLKAILWARLTSHTNGQAPAQAEVRLLTIPDVAGFLGVTHGYAYELARRGDLPTVRFGKYVRVELSTLHAWIARHGEKRLDRRFNVTLISPRDRRRGTKDPKKAPTHTGSVRRAHRGPPRDREPVGARSHGDTGVGRPTHSAAGEDGLGSKG